MVTKTWKFSIIPVAVSKSHLGLNVNLRSMGQARYNLVYPKGSQLWPSTSPPTNLLSYYFTKSFLITWRCFRVNLSSRSIPHEVSSCSLCLTNCKQWNEDDLQMSSSSVCRRFFSACCGGQLPGQPSFRNATLPSLHGGMGQSYPQTSPLPIIFTTGLCHTPQGLTIPLMRGPNLRIVTLIFLSFFSCWCANCAFKARICLLEMTHINSHSVNLRQEGKKVCTHSKVWPWLLLFQSILWPVVLSFFNSD